MVAINYVLYGILLSVWVVIGLICWIPLLIRATAAVAAGILYHAFNNSDPSNLTVAFENAVTFYPRGFTLIREVLLKEGGPTRTPGTATTKDSLVGRFLVELSWTAIFWGGVVIGIARLFAPDRVFPSVGGYLDNVNFFSAGDSIPPSAERIYRDQFDSVSTRYIWMELNLRQRPTSGYVTFPIQCRYLYPDGSDHNSATMRLYTPLPNSTRGQYVFAWGSRTPGVYPRGYYTAECSFDGNTFVRRGFTIR